MSATMKTATRSRPGRGLSSAPRSLRQPSRGGRPVRGTGSGPFRQGFLSGMGIGMTISLVIVGVALFTGIGARPIASVTGTGAATAGHEGHGAQTAPAGGSTTPTTIDPRTAANVEVSARHLGNLQVLIEADVASKQSNAALIKADVVASTDMTEMPGSHFKSNIKLEGVDGRPGHYAAVTKVPMVGQYDVKVQSTSPLQGTGEQLIDIGTVGGSQNGVPTP